MKLLRYTLLIAALAVLSAGFTLDAKPPIMRSSYGKLHFYMDQQWQLLGERSVVVWVPDGYKTGEPCDVLYMHDGQMLFDSAGTWNKQEWEVDEVLGKLTLEDKVRRTIVVAIDNCDNRIGEYFPLKVLKYVPEELLEGVDMSIYTADDYLKFIVEELKPFIDKTYQPLTDRDHTWLMGSSMGGLISLYVLCEYPDVFGGAACLSTHSSMMGTVKGATNFEPLAQALRTYLITRLPDSATHRVYMDRGTVELDGTYKPYQNEIDKIFEEKGWDADHYMSRVFDGHKHQETFWAQRLDVPMMFLFGK